MNFTNNIFLNNLETLRNSRKMKIGDLEKMVGVSAGYFSRLAKNPDNLPGVDLVVKLSGIFNVSLDTLLMLDMNRLGSDEKRILNVLRKIHNRTIHGMMEWKRDTKNLMYGIGVEFPNGGAFNHPYETRSNGYPFKAQFNEEIVVEIRPIKLTCKGVVYECFEFYLVKGTSTIPLCSTDMVHPLIQTTMNELVSIVMKSFSDRKLSNDARSILDDILGDEEF